MITFNQLLEIPNDLQLSGPCVGLKPSPALTAARTRITLRGKNAPQPERQRYDYKTCQRKFEDLTLTIFAGHTTSR